MSGEDRMRRIRSCSSPGVWIFSTDSLDVPGFGEDGALTLTASHRGEINSKGVGADSFLL
jgi:hypothetical protein